MQAQTFLRHLTEKVAGQGAVTVLQDSRLDAIVNGEKRYVPKEGDDSRSTITQHAGNRIKARGFRIQVYFGGSTRADQSKAQQAGNRVAAVFPELAVYTKFDSPNWHCRVGDFATREEANEYLQKLKAERLATNANVVRSEVYVYK